MAITRSQEANTRRTEKGYANNSVGMLDFTPIQGEDLRFSR